MKNNISKMIKEKKKIWESPWGYLESFFITIGLAIIALGLDIIIPLPVPLFHFPVNLIVLITGVFSLIVLHFFFKKTIFVRWLGSTPAAVSAIIFFAFVSLLMALVPQSSGKYVSILKSVISTKLYFIAIFYFLLILGYTTVKRSIPFKKKNITFIINHLGIWIVIVASHLGAGSIEKYTMYLYKDKKINNIFDEYGNAFKLDTEIMLNEFSIEEYAPKIALIDAKTGDFLKNKGKKAVFELKENSEIEIDNFTLKILEFLPLAARFSETEFREVTHPETAPAVLLEVKDKKGKLIQKRWVSYGNTMTPVQSLLLTKEKAIVMTKPEVKTYTSDVSIFIHDKLVKKAKILVNKPLSFGKWKIYQTGYDEKKGKLSKVSIVELVSDTWIKYVYLGCFLMLIGTFFMIKQGTLISKKLN